MGDLILSEEKSKIQSFTATVLDSDIKQPVCLVPFQSLYIDTDFEVKPCCIARAKTIGALPAQGLREIWDANDLMKFRTDLIDQRKLQDCASCWVKEENGIRSRRQLFREGHPISDLDVKPEQPLEKLVFIDLSLGRQCNLSCLFCGPHFSTTWSKLAQKLPSKPIFERYKEKHSVRDLQDVRMLISELCQLPALKILELKGGEPLLHPLHQELLERLIDEKKSASITLQYSTNLTHLPKTVLALWQKFKRVVISVSIEGTDLTQRYIRGEEARSLEVIFPNMRRLRKALTNVKIVTLTTICAYNVLELPEIDEEIKSQANFVEAVKFNMVYAPRHLSPFVVNADSIEREKLRWRKSVNPKLRELASQFQITWSTEEITRHRNQFFEFTLQVDVARNLDVRDYLKEKWSRL